MDQSIRLIAATETTPELASELGGWFEAEFGPRAGRWASADYYVCSIVTDNLPDVSECSIRRSQSQIKSFELAGSAESRLSRGSVIEASRARCLLARRNS